MKTGITLGRHGDAEIEIFMSHEKLVPERNKISHTTTATVKIGPYEWQGLSHCVKSDQFNRHEGAKRALARAFAGAGVYLDKTTRKLLWSKFFNGKYDVPTTAKHLGQVEPTFPFKRINTEQLEFRVWSNKETANV